MNEGLIARRYAKALYAYAAELGQEQALYGRMQTLAAALATLPDLSEALRNPTLSLRDRATLLNEAAGPQPEPSYLAFVRLVLARHREESLRAIALGYTDYYRRKKHISIVRLVSAVPMSDEALARIRRQVALRTHGEVEFENGVDPSIDGGFIFRLNDYRLDASVKGQLGRIRRELYTATQK